MIQPFKSLKDKLNEQAEKLANETIKKLKIDKKEKEAKVEVKIKKVKKNDKKNK